MAAAIRDLLPAGAEFALLTIYALLVYTIIRPFGAAAQAGFGVGIRVMQAMFLPVVALSFAVGPVIGQNFGARRADRVRHTVFAAIGLASAMMLVLTITAWLAAPAFIRPFSHDADVIAFGGEFLTIVSLNFLAAGIAFSCSSVFQGLGNTIPSLLTTASRLVLFALPALVISRTAGFQIRHVWYLSAGSQAVQAVLILFLLKRELRRKLRFAV
jgi:Na+-driven multidrug efflux pump